MLGWAALGMGFFSKAQCAEMVPCKPAMSRGRSFKLSFCIHSVSLPDLDGASVKAAQRPYITITVGDKTKQTELADWCREERRWRFGEAITMEVGSSDEALITVVCNKQYNLVVAALAVSSRCVGEACVPIASVLPMLSMEDRDIDGLIYATQDITFDLLKDGAKIGRASLAFETKQPPPPSGSLGGGGGSKRSPCPGSAVEGPWCNFSARG